MVLWNWLGLAQNSILLFLGGLLTSCLVLYIVSVNAQTNTIPEKSLLWVLLISSSILEFLSQLLTQMAPQW
jgi:hypothetical protein